MKKTIRDIQDWRGKRALVRVDFNVPLDGEGRITDDTRIREALPTLQTLCEKGARIILMSHLGRPKGAPEDAFRLTPVAARLQELMPQTRITLARDVVSPDVQKQAEALAPGEILLLENVRFEPGETKNDPALAQALASMGDIFVNDAFGAAHRAHASTEGVGRLLSMRVAGLLMEKEINALSSVVQNPARPYAAIIGGSKVSSKITVLKNLMNVVDHLVVGGAMMFTFLKAQGLSVGSSLVEDEYLDTARELAAYAQEKGVQLVLPRQVVIADAFAENAQTQVVSVDAIPDGWMGLDIGPDAIVEIANVVKTAKTVLWNGPLGVFEMAPFAAGTRAIAEAVAQATAQNGCRSVLGGGDTVAAIEQFGMDPHRFTHVSTGGGASLEFLEGQLLPGIAVLDDVGAPAPASV